MRGAVPKTDVDNTEWVVRGKKLGVTGCDGSRVTSHGGWMVGLRVDGGGWDGRVE